jgi:hypothetical protein
MSADEARGRLCLVSSRGRSYAETLALARGMRGPSIGEEPRLPVRRHTLEAGLPAQLAMTIAQTGGCARGQLRRKREARPEGSPASGVEGLEGARAYALLPPGSSPTRKAHSVTGEVLSPAS